MEASEGGSEDVDAEHPPDEKQRNNGENDVGDPLEGRFRFAEFEHLGVLPETEATFTPDAGGRGCGGCRGTGSQRLEGGSPATGQR